VTVSTASAVLDSLVTRVAAALPEVRVLDGGPLRDFKDDGLAIGYTPQFGDDVVSDTRTRDQMESSPDAERYDITNLAWSWHGSNTDQKAVRDRAYELVDAVAAELARDQTLGGLVMRAWVSSTALAQEQTNRGAVATVRFVISVYAFTR
jgi:hypothetical protein